VIFLRDGVAAFPAMLESIAGATHEVLLETHWFGADRVGKQFRAALVERARAGVRVASVFDGIGSFGTPWSFWALLLEAGALPGALVNACPSSGSMMSPTETTEATANSRD
jgi:cardiolipin synthase A/B